jgi:hypothetical protein
MPEINRFACNRCDFEFPTGWGGYCYAVGDSGQRVVCPLLDEPQAITRITGMSFGEAMDAGRTGSNSHCVCLICLGQFDLDLDRDRRVCPFCASTDVKSAREMVGQPCPGCKRGVVERGSLVRWELDPDRASLPVPQVVKDMLGWEKTREVPPRFGRVYEAIGRLPGAEPLDFFFIWGHLLDWWEGDYFGGRTGGGTDQKDCTGPYDDKWPWVQAFKLSCGTRPGWPTWSSGGAAGSASRPGWHRG